MSSMLVIPEHHSDEKIACRFRLKQQPKNSIRSKNDYYKQKAELMVLGMFSTVRLILEVRLVATDGVWEILSNNDVYTIVRSIGANSASAVGDAARRLETFQRLRSKSMTAHVSF
eukprot:CAMPEP_0118691400 /NCGR_PEP_ID=MMETSP0800-20121206/10659_1 /TAXON_ID=210618 ORGANISM="Striatella unipunctata, Strain CCMP2910" /NCGR_SAMPLE_ID=MMETSP0800 /ASSEMBLY_ACC=CAM_ASM_000638 /LENGTH=114 /DNA_ID=CAMNT_0006589175 /DNA_START=98 /DNA_END=442 /DNA_ORIENTATION=+